MRPPRCQRSLLSPLRKSSEAARSPATAPSPTPRFSTPAAASRSPGASIEALFDLVDGASTSELRVEVGGAIVQSGEVVLPGRSEAIGLAAGAVILLVAFGSVVAVACRS